MLRAVQRSSRHVQRLLAFAVGMALALPPVSSSAGEKPVAIGEVSANPPAGAFTLPLRSALEAELAAAELGHPREHFVLSARLMRLETERSGSNVRATAVVSLVLRREKQQALHAILQGRATAEEAEADLDDARQTALRAAVRSAVRRLPEAVR